MEDVKKCFILLTEISLYPYIRTLSLAGQAFQSKHYEILVSNCTGRVYNTIINTRLQKKYNPLFSKTNFDTNYKQCIKEYGFSSFEFDKLVSESDFDEILKFSQNTSYNQLLEFRYKEYQVGTIAIYNFVLTTKKLKLDYLFGEDLELYRVFFLNTYYYAVLGDKLCRKVHPDVILAFNPYSENQSVHFFAKQYSIKFITLTAIDYCGSDYSRFQITENFAFLDIFTHCQNWVKNKDIRISEEKILAGFEDSLFHFYGSGSHIFSKAKQVMPEDLVSQLKLDKTKKTLIAFTSSYDEQIGSDFFLKAWNISNPIKALFSSQIEWLKYLLEYATKHQEIQIIIRIHPREWNEQQQIASEHLLLLKETFESEFDSICNFHIVWANSPISSYDLLELADLCLIFISTMGLECARLGIPVLSYAQNQYYCNDNFMHIASSLADYDNSLSNMLKNYSADSLSQALKFNAWRVFMNKIDCSEEVPHDFTKIEWPKISKKLKDSFFRFLVNSSEIVDYNTNRNISTKQTENKALMLGIRMLIDRTIFYTPKNDPYFILFMKKIIQKVIYILTLNQSIYSINKKYRFKDYKLLIFTNSNDYQFEKKKNCVNTKLVLICEKELLFYFNKIEIRRFSPMFTNLLKCYLELEQR